MEETKKEVVEETTQKEQPKADNKVEKIKIKKPKKFSNKNEDVKIDLTKPVENKTEEPVKVDFKRLTGRENDPKGSCDDNKRKARFHIFD